MRWEWHILEDDRLATRTCGDDPADACRLAYLVWSRDVDVSDIDDRHRLAGLLNWRSSLSLRRIVACLGVEKLAAVGTDPPSGRERWTFTYRGAPLHVECGPTERMPAVD